MLIVNTPGDPLDIQYLNGRHYSDTHPYAGMSLLALYDLDANALSMKMSDTLTGIINWGTVTLPYTTVGGVGVGFWWGASSITTAYYTDQADFFGTPYNVLSSANKNQRIYKEYTDDLGTRSVEYLRSTLDGVTIDFNLSDYMIAAADSTMQTFSQVNDKYGNQDFDFNAILVYYDVYDPTLTGPNDSATNLYGVYFLNKVTQNGGEFIIPYITKHKPNPINKTNGNAFAYKINVKLDNSIEDVAVEKSINDYSTFSLDLFVDVLSEIRQLQTKFNDKLLELQQLGVDLNNAKDSLLNENVISSLNKRIGQLETTVSASTQAFAEADSIMKLIDSVNQRIEDILSNSTSLLITYNTALFKQGYGVSLDKRIPGEITFNSNIQNYSAVSVMDISANTLGIKTMPLGIAGTQIRHLKLNMSMSPISYSMTNDITLQIDDTINAWKKGQVLRLVFDSQIIPSTYSIYVKTDALNITNQISPYGVQIVALTASDFPTSYGRTGTSIIEMTCTDPVALTFVVDKIIR